jgi:hypothetical protein
MASVCKEAVDHARASAPRIRQAQDCLPMPCGFLSRSHQRKGVLNGHPAQFNRPAWHPNEISRLLRISNFQQTANCHFQAS